MHECNVGEDNRAWGQNRRYDNPSYDRRRNKDDRDEHVPTPKPPTPYGHDDDDDDDRK